MAVIISLGCQQDAGSNECAVVPLSPERSIQREVPELCALQGVVGPVLSEFTLLRPVYQSSLEIPKPESRASDVLVSVRIF